MQFTMSNDCLPIGAYRARYMGCEPFTERAEDYGPAVVLHWQVIDGPYAGADVSRICSARLSAKSNLGKFATAIKGSAIAPGETVDLRSFAGATGTVVIGAASNSEYTRVESFLRDGPPAQQQYGAPQQQAPAPQYPAAPGQPVQQQYQHPVPGVFAGPAPAGNGSISGCPPSRAAMAASQGEIPF